MTTGCPAALVVCEKSPCRSSVVGIVTLAFRVWTSW
jgi:hypothetical protein